MKEVYQDMFKYAESLYNKDINVIICITTNGYIKKNGEGVMGRGNALKASKIWPSLPKMLGNKLNENGNKVQFLGMKDKLAFVMFPVKENWWESADINIIRKSCTELMELVIKMTADGKKFEVLLPRPGCGNGKLNWNACVKYEIKKLLSDAITIMHNGPSEEWEVTKC